MNTWKPISQFKHSGKYYIFYDSKSEEFKIYNWPDRYVIGVWTRNYSRNKSMLTNFISRYCGLGDTNFHPTHFMSLPKKPNS